MANEVRHRLKRVIDAFLYWCPFTLAILIIIIFTNHDARFLPGVSWEVEASIFGFVFLVLFTIVSVKTYQYLDRRQKEWHAEGPRPIDETTDRELKAYAKRVGFSVKRVRLDDAGRRLLRTIVGTGWPDRFFAQSFGENPALWPQEHYYWYLTGAQQGYDVSILCLPKLTPKYHKTREHIAGFVIIRRTIPPTGHWFALDPETLFSPGDHQLEFRAFNWKYYLNASDKKMLTEIFDPTVIERLSRLKLGQFSMQLRDNRIVAGCETMLTSKEIEWLLKFTEEMYTRFVKAARTTPEPREE